MAIIQDAWLVKVQESPETELSWADRLVFRVSRNGAVLGGSPGFERVSRNGAVLGRLPGF